MPRVLASRLNLRDDENEYDSIESFEVDFETDDGHEHTVIYEADYHLHEHGKQFGPTMLISDFLTGYNEFTEENALSCIEMLEEAANQLMITAADDYELRHGYTLSPERYNLCVSTYGPMSHDFDATMQNPTKPDGCELVIEKTTQGGTRFVVRDWNGQLHQILFNDGKLIDSDSGYSLLSADTLDATFAAIRFVQAELISRGDRIETMYEIELYNTDTVAEHRH